MSLEAGYPILIIFGTIIVSATTGHQMTDRSVFHLTQCLLLHYLGKP